MKPAAVFAALLALAIAGCGDSPGTDRPAGTASKGGSGDSCCDVDGEPLMLPGPEAKRLGVPITFENDLGLRFVLVPGGTFWMGSPTTESGRESDEHRHEAKIFDPYYMQASEVTVAQWAKGPIAVPKGQGPADGPVTGIEHDEALAFAKWLSEHDPDRKSTRLNSSHG